MCGCVCVYYCVLGVLDMDELEAGYLALSLQIKIWYNNK